jgi:ABC-type nickel/cobalt efflux system permease component RcnA
VRAEGGARISQVTDAVVFLGANVDQFHSDLIQIDTDLDTIQLSVREFQRLAPPMILSSAIILSLLAGWVVYSQVLIFYRSVRLNHEKNNDVSIQEEAPLDEG